MKKCPAVTKSTNKPCRVHRLVDGEFCQYHSPLEEWVKKRTEVARAGGKSYVGTRMAMKNFRLSSPQDMLYFLEKIIENVARGHTELTTAYVKLIPLYSKEFRELYSLTKLEERLKVFEQDIDS